MESPIDETLYLVTVLAAEAAEWRKAGVRQSATMNRVKKYRFELYLRFPKPGKLLSTAITCSSREPATLALPL
jgi:hypothetical protein